MSSLVLADPTHALALAVIVCFSTKRLVDLYKIYHENGTMPSMGFLRDNFHEGFDRAALVIGRSLSLGHPRARRPRSPPLQR